MFFKLNLKLLYLFILITNSLITLLNISKYYNIGNDYFLNLFIIYQYNIVISLSIFISSNNNIKSDIKFKPKLYIIVKTVFLKYYYKNFVKFIYLEYSYTTSVFTNISIIII